MSRRKQPALAVPATDDGAIALIVAYGEVEREIRVSAERADAIVAAANAEHDAFVAEVAPLQRDRFAALKSWWEAGGAARIAGKKRSAELAGAKIGVRLSPPAVKVPKGVTLADLVDWLTGLDWAGKTRFLRTKTSLDKEAIIAAFRGTEDEDTDAQSHFTAKLVRVVQDDEFFIDVGPSEAAKASIPE